jgi:hypothetical protein
MSSDKEIVQIFFRVLNKLVLEKCQLLHGDNIDISVHQILFLIEDVTYIVSLPIQASSSEKNGKT